MGYAVSVEGQELRPQITSSPAARGELTPCRTYRLHTGRATIGSELPYPLRYRLGRLALDEYLCPCQYDEGVPAHVRTPHTIPPPITIGGSTPTGGVSIGGAVTPLVLLIRGGMHPPLWGQVHRCSRCRGTGVYKKKRCGHCHGIGSVPDDLYRCDHDCGCDNYSALIVCANCLIAVSENRKCV